jgi:chromosome segregation ATPase
MEQGTIAIIVAVLAFIPSFLSVIKQWKKDKQEAEQAKIEQKKFLEDAENLKAEANKTSVSTALSLVTPLKERIKELEQQLAEIMIDLKEVEHLLEEREQQLEEREKELRLAKEAETRYIETIKRLNNKIEIMEYDMQQCKEDRAKFLRQLEELEDENK